MNNTSIALNTVRIIFGLTAICGNLLIVICMLRYRLLRTPTNLLIANLAAADFLNGCNMFAVPIMNLTFCSGYSSTHYSMKRIKIGFVQLGFLTNNLAIFCIALERFICIRLALRYKSIVTFSRVLFTIILTWICGVIFSFSQVPLNFAERQVIVYCINGVIMFGTVILYIYVVTIAYKRSREVAPLPQVVDGRTAEALDNQKAQWKITKFLALVLGVYCVSYVPWVISTTVSGVDSLNYCYTSGFIGFFTVIIWGFNINVNSFLYVWKAKNFRIHLKKMLGIKCNEIDS